MTKSLAHKFSKAGKIVICNSVQCSMQWQYVLYYKQILALSFYT